MLGDIGHPELVRLAAAEVTLDQVSRRRIVQGAPIAGTAREALDARSSHQVFDGLMPDGDTAAEDQLGCRRPGGGDAGVTHCSCRSCTGSTERVWSVDEHFTVDGTQIEAAGSVKRFRPKHEPVEDELATGTY